MSHSVILISRKHFKPLSFLMENNGVSHQISVVENLIINNAKDPKLSSIRNIYHTDLQVLINYSGFSVNERIDICSTLFNNAIPFSQLRILKDASLKPLFFVEEFNIDSVFDSDVEVLNDKKNNNAINDKILLITGGAGSIGSGLVDQLQYYNPKEIIVLDNSEHNLYNLKISIEEQHPMLKLTCILGDISHKNTLVHVFSNRSIDIVIHTAAYKQLPLLESFKYECARINIIATVQLFEIAEKYKVEKFVFISTDKAVEPVSVMGVTKHIAEQLLFEKSKTSKTIISSIRLGNVLNSNGSVIPFFKDRLKDAKTLKITGEKMRRYFITKNNACDLILKTVSIAEQGETFVFEMNMPILIKSLGKLILNEYDFKNNTASSIQIVNKRSGEKYNEILLKESDIKQETEYKMISKIIVQNTYEIEISSWYCNLEQAVSKNERERVSSLLKKFINN